MYNSTLCYIENPQGEYLMLHRIKKKNDLNHDKWVGVGASLRTVKARRSAFCGKRGRKPA